MTKTILALFALPRGGAGHHKLAIVARLQFYESAKLSQLMRKAPRGQ